jgi:hypothetical protein
VLPADNPANPVDPADPAHEPHWTDSGLPEPAEELSFNRSAGARPTPDEIRGGSAG